MSEARLQSHDPTHAIVKETELLRQVHGAKGESLGTLLKMIGLLLNSRDLAHEHAQFSRFHFFNMLNSARLSINYKISTQGKGTKESITRIGVLSGDSSLEELISNKATPRNR